MKFLYLVFLIIFILCCKTPENKNIIKKSSIVKSESTRLVDSLKWVYFSYIYDQKILFKKGASYLILSPTRCNIDIESVDTFKINYNVYTFVLKYYDFKFVKFYDGINTNGLVVGKSIIRPLTGMLILDSLNDASYLKKLNNEADNSFKQYLRSVDKDSLSDWLRDEAIKKGVF